MDGRETQPGSQSARRPLVVYYAATAVFLALDYLFDINIRVAFLEQHSALKAAYYGFCFACLGLMAWRPDWTVLIGAFESLVTLVALIIATGMRVLLMTTPDGALSAPPLTFAEILNFLLAGSIAYYAWSRGVGELARRSRAG